MKRLSQIFLTLSILTLVISGGLKLTVLVKSAQANTSNVPINDLRNIQSEVLNNCDDDAYLESVLITLSARKAELEERMAALDARENTLIEQSKRLDERSEAARQSELRIQKMLNIAPTVSEDDINNLVGVYSEMKPKNVAKIFEVMDPDLASGFLRLLPNRQAATILSNVKPEIANQLSVKIASRDIEIPSMNKFEK